MLPSLPKLLGLFAVIWLVWMVFRFFELRKKKSTNQSSDYGENKFSGKDRGDKSETSHASVDLQECDLCGAWVNGEACKRENCPF